MKYNKNDLIGKRFGKLSVIAETDNRADSGSIVWQCKCVVDVIKKKDKNSL